MKVLIGISGLIFGLACSPKIAVSATGNSDYEAEISAWQAELNDQYQDPEHSPLPPAQRESFVAHPFFPIDPAFRIEASLAYPSEPEILQMPTSSGSMKTYSIWAIASFVIGGRAETLQILKPFGRLAGPSNYLFIPFQDETSGEETYGGGRYLDLPLPEGRPTTLVIDFNKAYHPYCAYTDGYNCPIPPQANRLGVRVAAGIKLQI